jgi:hypothetical protein
MHPFIKHIKCQNVQLKYLYVCSYMFRSNWTILREHLLSLAKVTILWNRLVKVHRYMICGVVVINISGCDVCTATILPQYCDFSKAQHTLPEDGPIGPKHVGANIEIF